MWERESKMGDKKKMGSKKGRQVNGWKGGAKETLSNQLKKTEDARGKPPKKQWNGKKKGGVIGQHWGKTRRGTTSLPI